MTRPRHSIRATIILPLLAASGLSLLAASGLAGCTASQASRWAQTAPSMAPVWTAAGDGTSGAVNLGLRDPDPAASETVTPAP